MNTMMSSKHFVWSSGADPGDRGFSQTRKVTECADISLKILMERKTLFLEIMIERHLPASCHCDSFHGIAAIREIDRQVASLSERVRTRAGERERE